uniref:Uncharacterized protein n=1 Tax=Panagrolaimus davidi TaxID=227884 RepID=A0A914PGZ1_9BILA
MHALPSGTCELIFLNQPLAMKGLKEFYIHGHSKKPVIMYSGLEDKVHILNFSKTETKPWKKIYLGAMFYTILIPQDSSLLVKTFETYNLPRCTFGNDPFCSFIDTPYFGNPNTYKYEQKQIGFYIILCNPVIFTIQNFDVSKNGRLWFEANNNVTIDITAVGQKEIFDHTNLSIYFYEYDLGHIGARIYVTNAS